MVRLSSGRDTTHPYKYSGKEFSKLRCNTIHFPNFFIKLVHKGSRPHRYYIHHSKVFLKKVYGLSIYGEVVYKYQLPRYIQVYQKDLDVWEPLYKKFKTGARTGTRAQSERIRLHFWPLTIPQKIVFIRERRRLTKVYYINY